MPDRDHSPKRKGKYEFRIQMKNTQLFKMVTKAIKMLLDDARFEIHPDEGLTMQTMDPAHVSLVQLHIAPRGFMHFECLHPTTIGLSVKSLAAIMDRADKNAQFELSKLLAKEEILIAWQTDSRRVEYNLKLIDIESDDLGIPETEYETIVAIDSKEFKKMTLDFQRSCDELCLQSSVVERQNFFTFFAKSDDVSGKCIWKEGSDMQVVKMKPITQSFSSRYLQIFSGACPLSTKVVLSMAKDVPLYVRFLLTLENQEEEESTETVGVLGFYLAPKIDNE